MTKFLAGIIALLGVAALVFGLGLLLAFPVMWLWNYLMPALFGLKELDYWQA